MENFIHLCLGCQVAKHIPLLNFMKNFDSGSLSASTNTIMSNVVREAKIKSLEEAVKNVLLDIKQVYNLVDSKAVIAEIVQSCKQIVNNIKNLEKEAEESKHKPLTESVDAFKNYLMDLIRAGKTK